MDWQVPGVEDSCHGRKSGLVARRGCIGRDRAVRQFAGYPDNLMRGLDGKIWLGFAKPRNPKIDNMADKPFLRKLTLRLPRAPVASAKGLWSRNGVY